MSQTRTFLAAVYRLYEHSGFTMASAVAFSFVVSLFPFCIFIGAVAGIVGGRDLAAKAVSMMFEILPGAVAQALVPQVEQILGQSRIDLLTFGAFLALFFATSAVETLRAALNGAYRVVETRSYPKCLGLSMMLVFFSAVSMVVLAWAVVVGPVLAERLEPQITKTFLDSTWLGPATRYAIAGSMIAAQLFAFHLWLAAGQRSISDVWPGVVVTVVLWLAIAGFYSVYLGLSNYTRFYGGLSQLMIALIFFQVTAAIIILGAEVNRGIIELKKYKNGTPEGQGTA